MKYYTIATTQGKPRGPYDTKDAGGNAGILLYTDEGPISDEERALFLTHRVLAIFDPGTTLRWRELPGQGAAHRYFINAWAPSRTPDNAAPDYFVTLREDDKLVEYSPHTRWVQCTEISKQWGCSSCEFRGKECYTRGVNDPRVATTAFRRTALPVLQPICAPVEQVVGLHDLKTYAPVVAGFEYVSPTRTTPEDHYFNKFVRHYDDHDFTRIDDLREAHSERSRAAAKTRRFKQTECAKCVISKSKRCVPAACVGAYPPEEEINARILAQHAEKFRENNPETALTLWQFWVCARAAGREGAYAPDKKRPGVKRKIILGGVVETYAYNHGQVYSVRVYRNARPYDESLALTYAEAAEAFNLPLNEADVPDHLKPPESLRMRAIYARLCAYTYPPVRIGNGDQPVLHKLRLRDDEIEISLARSRYPWQYGTSVSTWQDVFTKYTRSLNVMQTRTRAGEAYD